MIASLPQSPSGDLGMAGPMRILRTMRVAIPALSLAALAGCQGGLGKPSAPPAPSPGHVVYIEEFKRIDTANKGTISLDEARAYYAQLFARLDVRHDGRLDAKELDAAVPMIAATSGDELVSRLDRNGDGKISQDEFLVAANWLFQLARNGDNLSLKEVETNGVATVAPSVKKETGAAGSEHSKF